MKDYISIETINRCIDISSNYLKFAREAIQLNSVSDQSLKNIEDKMKHMEKVVDYYKRLGDFEKLLYKSLQNQNNIVKTGEQTHLNIK